MKSIDAQFAYTWSKSLANTDITNSGNTSNTTTITDVTNQNLDYGPTPIDRPHVFVSNIVYNLPSFKGQARRVRAIAGDWELAGILQYASGPSQSIFGLNGGATMARWPATNPAAQLIQEHRGFRVLDTRQPEAEPGAPGLPGARWHPSTSGTTRLLSPWTTTNLEPSEIHGVGSCTGPGIANTDFSMYKNFKVTERVDLQFRMEFYNLFNKTQFRADQNNFQLASGAVACTEAAT